MGNLLGESGDNVLSRKRENTRLMIYSHDSFGLGHLRRCRAIAHSLVGHRRDLSVLILSGSPIVGSFDFHGRVDFVRIPGVIKLRRGDYTSLNLDIGIDDMLALRAGFYLDPAPGPAKTQTIMIPQADYNVVAGGVGYKLNDKLSFDFAVEYLMGKEFDVSETEAMDDVGMPGTHGMNIFVWSLAATYQIK